MRNRNLLVLVGLLILVGIGVYLYNNYPPDQQPAQQPPAQQDTQTTPTPTVPGNNGMEEDKSDMIIVANPQPNQLASSPLTVSGLARGNWYFEASFPIFLYDEDNNLLGQAIAQAQGDWMTTDFVPFSTTITFQRPATGSGVLVLEKDNPSGLPENADSLRIPVRF